LEKIREGERVAPLITTTSEFLALTWGCPKGERGGAVAEMDDLLSSK